MEIALNSILIFLFIIFPGIVYRRFYFRGEFTKQFDSKSVLESIIVSVFPGLIVQFATIFTYERLVVEIDGEKISDFYQKTSDNGIPDVIFDFDGLFLISLYIGIMVTYSFLFAQISWYVVRLFKLDRRFTIFRFNNYWHYYFRGEIKDFKEFRGMLKRHVLSTYVDVIMKIEDGKSRLYSGHLIQYTISRKDNKLENIYLANATRQSKYHDDEKFPKIIPGHLLIIPFNENVMNINLRYVLEPEIDKMYKRERFIENKNLVNGLAMFGGGIFIIIDFFFFFYNPDSVWKTIGIKVFSFIDWLLLIVFVDSIIDYKSSAKKLKAGLIVGILFWAILIALLLP